MKTAIVFVIFAVGLATTAYLPILDPETCQDPDKVPGRNCDFIHPGCLWPLCATDGLSAPRWFKSGCHMSAYNQQCRRRFHGISEAICSAESRPAASSVACPNN